MDPSAECDSTRGTVSDALVEAIDLAPTFVEFRAGAAALMSDQISWKVRA